MFVFICFVWGTTWLAMKIGIATVSPGIFAGLRWSIAGAMILAFRRFRGQRVMPPPRLIPRLVFVSIVLITLNQVIQLYGLKYITAGLGAVISSALTPIALLVFSRHRGAGAVQSTATQRHGRRRDRRRCCCSVQAPPPGP